LSHHERAHLLKDAPRFGLGDDVVPLYRRAERRE
jgi:hypothetical protein